MGCDIHIHVERRTESGWEAVPPPHDNIPWPEGERAPPGYFAAFGLDYEHFDPHDEPLLEWNMRRDSALFDALGGIWGGTPVAPLRFLPADVSPGVYEKATEEYPTDEFAMFPQYVNGHRFPDGRVLCPDWHSVSWLTRDELATVPEAAQLVAEMDKIGGETRVVFWFDN